MAEVSSLNSHPHKLEVGEGDRRDRVLKHLLAMAKMSSLNSHPHKLEVEGDRTEQSTQAFAAELISCSCSSTFYSLKSN
jgi:hypothetical protein